jgi:hypothetical protein
MVLNMIRNIYGIEWGSAAPSELGEWCGFVNPGLTPGDMILASFGGGETGLEAGRIDPRVCGG